MGGPACLTGDKISSQLSTVEAAIHGMPEDWEDGLGTTSRPHYAEYVLLCMLTYCKLDNCNRERRLICSSVSGE
jgi:hypothetical protein